MVSAFSSRKGLVTIPMTAFLLALFSTVSVDAGRGGYSPPLSKNFYAKTCPKLHSIVEETMQEAVENEKRMGASILRLFFHDCFVNGCDGSLLLDDTSTFTGEKNAFPNRNTRGFEVIDAIKTKVEAACKATVSCADILALATRDGVVALGGPSWMVKLGRRDARTASQATANSDLPPASANLTTLITMFRAKNLSPRDMTALSGAHTIGQARCATFRSHIYNDRNIDPDFAAIRKETCPSTGGNDNLAPMDIETPEDFDNAYYKNLINGKGIFRSDQVLFDGGSQDRLVKQYAVREALFNKDFAKAMERMGNISPLTGMDGEIRVNCRVVN